MKNSTYWRKRYEELEKALNRYGLKAYAMIQPEFDKAAREINLEIEKWLNRIAKNNEISMTAARKLLDKDQLAEFKWSVEEYIKYGRSNAVNQQWMKQLENASAKYHISRLEALKLQTQQAAEVAFGNYLDSVDSMARQFYSESYYRSAFELRKGFGVGWALDSIDDNKLSKLIAKPWAADGKNFSDRIWTAKSQMINDLHSELTRTCILGKAPDKAINHMSQFVNKKFKNAKIQAGRLVMTEQAFFSAAAQKDCFSDLGVEEFEIVATLDSRTSAICQELDGKHFPMSQYEPGVTAPPFHVWCRSTTCPYFDDEFSIGGRAARDADGKTYYVPSNMTYKEWRQSFVKNGNVLNKAKGSDAFQAFNAKNLSSKTTITENDIRNEMKNSPIGKEILNQIETTDVVISILQGVKPAGGQRGDQLGRKINIYLDNIKDVRIAAQTIIHEMTHFYYDIGNCQWAEAVCFAKEKMHIEKRNELTIAEKRYIVKLARDNYKNLNWKKGGYKNGIKF